MKIMDIGLFWPVNNAKIDVVTIQTVGEYDVEAQMILYKILLVDGGSKENVRLRTSKQKKILGIQRVPNFALVSNIS